MDIDGSLSDNREHSLSLSIEVESNIPIFNNRTIMPSDKIINTTISNIYSNNVNLTNIIKLNETT